MPQQSPPIPIFPSGGTAGITSGGATSSTVARVSRIPEQLIGLVPLISCTESECRTFNGSCYINPVFGAIAVNTSTYENDLNSFFVITPLRNPTKWNLQRQDPVLKTWATIATMSSAPASYGQLYSYGSITGHATYQGFTINWGFVLSLHGAGIYRIGVKSYGTGNRPDRYPFCYVSETFRLLPFNCNVADRTVKFEAYQTGYMGSIDNDGEVFDLCGFTFYDSVRMRGFFGKEKSNYDVIELEYPTGLIDQVRDEALQKFQWSSELLPKVHHDRLKAYCFMGNKVLVSDYNRNNSDYNIKQKQVVKAGGYEPTYYTRSRMSKVTVDFKEGIQGAIKSVSCDK